MLTPLEWLDRLSKRLQARQAPVRKLEDYYRGKHPMPALQPEAQREFWRLLQQTTTNWMGLVVDATAERLRVTGFRFGDDPSGDQDAWQLWQGQNLDAASELAHTTAGACGEAYALVWAEDGTDDGLQITVEHPLETIVEFDSTDHRRRLAALKRWRDLATSTEYATLYLPDAVYRWERPQSSTLANVQAGGSDWKPRADSASEGPNPLGVVPVVPLVNRPLLQPYEGRSEIEDVTAIQDRINATIFNRLLAAEFTAFRQRWVTGIEIPTDPETEQPIEPFKHAVNRLWISEDPETKFGEFGETGLGPYIGAVEADVQHIAAITRTPPHYLLGQSGAFPSGESLKSTETGLVAKVKRRQQHFGEAWEEVIRLAFAVIGDPRSKADDAETLWADPESRTEGEHVDALLKLSALGVPQQQLWEDAGYSPQQIARFRTMSAEDSLRVLLTHPRTAATPESAEVAPPPVEPTGSPFIGG